MSISLVTKKSAVDRWQCVNVTKKQTLKKCLYVRVSVCVFLSCVCLGKKLGFTIDLGKLHNVSLGQGQESVAELAMEKASREGHWVILQVCVCLTSSCLFVFSSHLPLSVERSSGGQMAGQSGETPGAVL